MIFCSYFLLIKIRTFILEKPLNRTPPISTEDETPNHNNEHIEPENPHTFQALQQIVGDSPLAQLSAYHRLSYLRYLPQILDFQNNMRNIPTASLPSIPPPSSIMGPSTTGSNKPQFSDTKLVHKGYNFYKSWENFSKRMGGVKGQ